MFAEWTRRPGIAVRRQVSPQDFHTANLSKVSQSSVSVQRHLKFSQSGVFENAEKFDTAVEPVRTVWIRMRFAMHP
jgi:hypothetical protein